MEIPFTVDQFLSVFEEYNRAIEPAPFLAYALGAVALVLAWRGGRQAARVVLAILAVFWIVCGGGYHLAFFQRINPAAGAFGVAFLVQATLLLRAALRHDPPTFAFRLAFRHVMAVALAAYALVAYARLGALAGHGYPRAPVFGVAPCPTTIFTIALLLLAERRPPIALLVIPVLWSPVDLSAAVQLGMREDYGLAAAGLAALWAAVERGGGEADAGRARWRGHPDAPRSSVK